MLKNRDAETMMQDARAMQAEAVRLMDAGDWRDAAGKGWLGVRNATAALVLEVAGEDNATSRTISSGLRKVSQERGGGYAELRDLWGKFAHYLHSEAFYDGVYTADLPEMVRDVADYIRRAEELAG